MRLEYKVPLRSNTMRMYNGGGLYELAGGWSFCSASDGVRGPRWTIANGMGIAMEAMSMALSTNYPSGMSRLLVLLFSKK
jgi:hypothetical protein